MTVGFWEASADKPTAEQEHTVARQTKKVVIACGQEFDSYQGIYRA